MRRPSIPAADVPNLIMLLSQKAGKSRCPNQKGLLVEIDPPATQRATDVAALLERGQLKMSFAMVVREDDWMDIDGLLIRDVIDVDLHDVAIVTLPAYPQTSVALRSLDRWKKQQGHCLDAARRRLQLAMSV